MTNFPFHRKSIHYLNTFHSLKMTRSIKFVYHMKILCQKYLFIAILNEYWLCKNFGQMFVSINRPESDVWKIGKMNFLFFHFFAAGWLVKTLKFGLYMHFLLGLDKIWMFLMIKLLDVTINDYIGLLFIFTLLPFHNL